MRKAKVATVATKRLGVRRTARFGLVGALIYGAVKLLRGRRAR